MKNGLVHLRSVMLLRIDLSPRTLSHIESDANDRCVARLSYSDRFRPGKLQAMNFRFRNDYQNANTEKVPHDACMGVKNVVLVGEIGHIHCHSL